MTNFTIKVTSDVACPWCYVGRKQLQQAQKIWQQKHPEDTFTVSYQPYQLNPDWPRGPGSSKSRLEYLASKFGEARVAQIHERLSQVGRETGIDFKYGGVVSNTRDSHRLVQLSKKYGGDVEAKTLDGLFAAQHENEKDISDYSVLKDVATNAGIPEADFQRAIVDSDQEGPEVDEAVRLAQLSGVRGVPDFVIQDQYRIPGAVDPSSFVEVLEELKEAGQ